MVAVITAAAFYFFQITSVKRLEGATVSLVNPGQPDIFLNASGYVVAQRRAAVASKGAGRLVELKVKEGDRVQKGEVMARLESSDVGAILSRTKANLEVAISAQVQARAELNEASLSYERKKNLLKDALISKADFDTVEAHYRSAQAVVTSAEAGVRASRAAVEAAEVDLENTIIRAPFDGTVLTKNAEIGEVVAPFGSSSFARAAVVTIADMTSLQVETDVSESNIEKIRVGQSCVITLDAYPDKKYEGIVQTIVPTADRAKATVLTKIRFLNQDGRVLPEMSARVAFFSESPAKGEERPRAAIHPGALVLRGGRKVAFLVKSDRVEEIPVEVGGPVGNLVEVKKGLKPGDMVVLNPPEGLATGERIKVITKQ